MKVTVWNPAKADDATLYENLLRYEEAHGGASTTLEMKDGKQLTEYLEATYNETDVELEHYIHPEPEHKYDLSPLDNNLYQFARMLSVIAETNMNDTKLWGLAGLLGMTFEEAQLILERAKKVESDLTLLQDEDPMVTRRARATINGDKDYTVNYDEGIEIVATDGRTLYDIDINDDGSLEVGVSGCVKHKGQLLDDHMVISPKGYGRVNISRTKYKG